MANDIKTYSVHVQPKYPAWNEVGGWDVEVSARNKRDACKAARRRVVDHDGNMGVIYFRATEVQS